MENEKMIKYISRNISEIDRAILNRMTLIELERYGSISHPFLKLIYSALFNDYIAHCMKVFELGKNHVGFWFLYEKHKNEIDNFVKEERISSLKEISQKLKSIRDKTHFHIDKAGALNSKAIWDEAGIVGKDLSDAVDVGWSVLMFCQKHYGLETAKPSTYDASIAYEVAMLVEEGRISELQ